MACAVAVAAGCQPGAPAPRHEWEDFREALRLIERREGRVETLTVGFDLTVNTPQGDPVTLEGAMVARRPGRMRLQAWRFHREVMDLTRRPEGTWLWTAEQSDEGADETAEAMPMPRDGGGDWFGMLFMTPDAETAELIDPGDATRPMVVTWPLDGDDAEPSGGGWIGRAAIDRATLTVRRLEIFDPEGAFVQRVTFSEHRSFGGLVFPMRIHAEGEFDATLRAHEVTLNEPLPAGVFEPPGKARRID